MQRKTFWLITVVVMLMIVMTGGPLMQTKQIAVASDGDIAYQLDIQASKKGVTVSPTLFGVFFEDINYGADGGLYAELIPNRSFEFPVRRNWSLVRKGEADGTFAVAKDNPLNAKNPCYARISVIKGEFGIFNPGFGRLPITSGENYNLSIYARSSDYTGPINISLEGADGQVYAKGQIPKITGTWNKYTCKLQANATETRARLVVTVNGAGTVDLDMVSLFPKTWKNRENGLRQDLVQLLADLKPKFFRFPGGCVVEGERLADAYDWKNSIGDVAERRETMNLWGVGKNYSYNQSYGLGFYEYFLLCEDIGAEPVPVLNVGMACQVRNKFYIFNDEPNIASPIQTFAKSKYVQDMIDLLEFANGPATSEWGAKRAAMGHPEPFHLKYLGVGNENWGPDYKERYDICRRELLARSPYAKKVKLIISSGVAPDSREFNDIWNLARSKDNYVDLVDEHFYMNPDWFYNSVNRYDEYERTGTKVFAGEYAAHLGSRRNSMEAALAEAAFLTGVVRNSDVVEMACYAPLLNHVNYSQWRPDLIFFNHTDSYGTPNYYVQKLFSNNTGTFTVPSNLRKLETNVLKPAYSIQGKIGLGSWLTEVEYKEVKVTSNTDGSVLFEDNFQKESEKWTPGRGAWKVRQGVMSQSLRAEDCRTVAGNQDWNNYTLTLKARKTGGNEGFLIPFGFLDAKNYYHLNIGGWGNTQTVIEKTNNGTGHIFIGKPIQLGIENGRWYDIKIVLNGMNIKCYVDNMKKPVIDATDVVAEGKLYSVVTKDKASGDLIVTVVNSAGVDLNTKINLMNVGNLGSNGTATVLTSGDLAGENSFSEPKKVAPVTSNFKVSPNFTYRFDKFSLTVLRIPEN
ncbi:MAG TPA: alpha-L-arabinofuranosidase C-terminal domain-containing protein [Bacillota bacterium]|nr:alpha-L-arabinofuranosidase C-terminal domain-containing protein [Bacillota bacterium]